MKLAGLRAVAEAAWDEAVAEMVRRQQHHDHSAVVNPYREGTP